MLRIGHNCLPELSKFPCQHRGVLSTVLPLYSSFRSDLVVYNIYSIATSIIILCCFIYLCRNSEDTPHKSSGRIDVICVVYIISEETSIYLCSAKAPVLQGSGSRRVCRRKGTSFDRVYVCCSTFRSSDIYYSSKTDSW